MMAGDMTSQWLRSQPCMPGIQQSNLNPMDG